MMSGVGTAAAPGQLHHTLATAPVHVCYEQLGGSDARQVKNGYCSSMAITDHMSLGLGLKVASVEHEFQARKCFFFGEGLRSFEKSSLQGIHNLRVHG